MATQYLTHGGPYRPELYIVKVQDVVPSGTTNYVVDLPPGLYNIAVYGESNIASAGTTTLDDFVPFMDAAQTIIPPAAGYEFNHVSPQQSAATVASTAFTNGATGSIYFHLINSEMAGAAGEDILLLYGLRFTFTIGAAVAGEKCIITIVAYRK